MSEKDNAPTHPFRGTSGETQGKGKTSKESYWWRALVFEARHLISSRERQETPTGWGRRFIEYCVGSLFFFSRHLFHVGGWGWVDDNTSNKGGTRGRKEEWPYNT